MRLTVFCCDPEQALHDQLAAECERAWRAREQELDLERERELHPPTAVQQPDVVCEAVVRSWDAYGSVTPALDYRPGRQSK